MCIGKNLGRFRVRIRPFTIEHIYAYITHEYNVIIMSYLRHCYILRGHYVFAYKLIKMKEKKLDISPFLYIFLMIIIFAMSL